MDPKKYYCIIKVLGEDGTWYHNAFIENSFDAVMVAKFYRDQLGYSVQLWKEGKDVSFLLDGKEQ